MRVGTGALLLVSGALFESVHANWEPLTKTTPAAATAWNVYKTAVVTETVWKEKTVYNTAYSTVTAKELITTTVVSTKHESVPTTIISTKTEPVTVYVTSAATVTNQNTVTQVNTVVNQNTITQVDTRVQTNTAVSIQYSTVTVTDSRPTTVTAVCNPTTVSITVSTTSSSTGLVTCPSRIINPTYTPPTPLPSNYRWGCPPGYICQPTQENCNFEQNIPADTYICPPEQCQKAGPLPILENFSDIVNQGNSCAWLTPPPGYFNLNPIRWGLSFAIFNVSGQATCPAETSWSTWSKPTRQSSTRIAQSTWATWSELHTRSSSSSSKRSQWDSWNDVSKSPSPTPVSHATPYASQITPRAVLMKRAKDWPGSCYHFCDYAVWVWQGIGNDLGKLCQPDGTFSRALREAESCSIASIAVATDIRGNPDFDKIVASCSTISLAPAPARRLLGTDNVSSAPLETTSSAPMSMTTDTISSSPSPVVSPSSGDATATGSSAPISSTVATTTSTRSTGSSNASMGKTAMWAGILGSLLSLMLLL